MKRILCLVLVAIMSIAGVAGAAAEESNPITIQFWNSFTGADGDLLVVDKSLEAYDGCVAVCFLDGEFTLKRLRMGQGKIVLVPANKRYKPIEIGQESDFTVWGVVTYAIKKV